MEQFNNNLDSDVIDLREILAILKKRYLVIVTLTLAALVTSGILSFFVMPPVYESVAVLRVDQAVDPANSYVERQQGLEGMMDSLSQLPEMTINTYVGQLESDAVMEKVVKKLHLDQNGYTPGSLAASIQVTAVKDTNLIELSATNEDPYLAAKIVNTLTEEFLIFMSENNEQQMSKSVEFLKQQASSSGTELKQALAGVSALEGQPRGVAMLEQLITAKSADLSKYQSQLMQVNMEYQQAVAGKNQAEAQLKYTPQYNKTAKETNGQILEVNEINPAYTELKSMVNAKAVATAELGIQVKSTQAIITQLTNELKYLQAEVAQKKSTLDSAKKEAERLEQTNTLLRSKIDETKIASSLKFGETSLVVVSAAMIPDSPIKPNKMLNMAIALVLGLMASVGLAFLLNYLDNTVKSPKEVEEALGLTMLGQIPYYNPDKPDALRR